MKKYIIGAGAIIGIALLLILNPFAIIESGERGVVTRFGKVQDEVLEEGLHWRTPILEKVNIMDIKIQKYEVSELAYSRDSQVVEAAVTLNYKLEPSLVKQVFSEVRKDYESRLINPAIKEGIKSIIAQYTAQGLLDNRPKVKTDIEAALVEQLGERGIYIVEVSITNLDFDDAYETAVREKQVAEQEALKQANITKSEAEKKDQEILKAQALSEKTRLEAVALNSAQGDKLIEKLYAEAAVAAAKAWDGKMPINMYANAPLPFIKVGLNQ